MIFPDEVTSNNSVQLTDERAKHIRTVLRAQPGKTLRIGLLNGPLGIGMVEKTLDESVMLSCAWEAAPPPRPAIDLLLAMPRPKVLKRLWAQFAALGVGRIILTNAEKVERFYFDTHVLDPDFYNARLVEGLQQARDTLLPEVRIVRKLKPFIEDELDGVFPRSGKRIIADPSGTQTVFQALVARDAPLEADCVGAQRFAAQGQSERVMLVVGPEGGWTPAELELFKAHGFEVFGMGPRILRTDTACIALLSQLSLCFSLE